MGDGGPVMIKVLTDPLQNLFMFMSGLRGGCSPIRQVLEERALEMFQKK